jgi:flagellar hook-length control protein FliK
VEVTVASHEFEQNLDGNSSAQEQGREAHGQETHQRRNLDLNNLDELSGLMSEEETLAATMMRDNGGSVDYTA